jgi:hypothetical protein
MRLKVTPMQAMGGLVALTLVTGGGNLWSSYDQARSQARAVLAAEQREQAEQRAAGAALEQKLCATFGKLAADKPPAGDPATNPSRGYEQNQHATLDELGTDLGCKAKGGSR